MLKFRTYNIILLLLVSTILAAVSCCKEPIVPKEPNPVYEEYWLGEAKDYMYFKPGTWWVYKNMQNDKTDSIYVTFSRLDTSIIKGTESYSKHRTIQTETTNVVTYSSRYRKRYDWYNRQKNPNTTNLPSQTTNWVRNKSNPGGYVQPCFHTPFTLKLRSDVPLLNNDTTLILNSKEYRNVKIFKLVRDNTYMDILFDDPTYVVTSTLMYYAPNYGIIKAEIPSRNMQIELQKSYIIQ